MEEYEHLTLPVQGKPSEPDQDLLFMLLAFNLAVEAVQAGEVPVGAVVVLDGQLIGCGRNRSSVSHDPTAHAEIEALRAAARAAENYRLPGATVYTTLEPCVMCAGALVTARVKRLVFATRDLRFGGVRSKFSLADSHLLNHRLEITEGVLAAEASELLLSFFERARHRLPVQV